MKTKKNCINILPTLCIFEFTRCAKSLMFLSNKLDIKWRHGEFFVHQSPNLNYSGREVLACLYDRVNQDIEFEVAYLKNNGMKKLMQWHHSWARGVPHTQPGACPFVGAY